MVQRQDHMIQGKSNSTPITDNNDTHILSQCFFEMLAEA